MMIAFPPHVTQRFLVADLSLVGVLKKKMHDNLPFAMTI
jgi:hypothetical protein